MRTAHKVAIARAACRGLALLRALAGRGMRTEARRGGVRWDLDLTEGIDLSIYLLGRFEPRVSRRLARIVRPGDTVVDVGANVGAHTLPLARAVGPSGRIIAYEPTSFAFEKLRANIALNPELAPRVLAVKAMLVDGPGRRPPREIYASWPLTPTPGLHPLHCGRLHSAGEARSVRLDDHLREIGVARVDVIKIDVDGTECEVLRGAVRTLSAHPPLIEMEWAPYLHVALGHDLRECVSMLRELGYEFEDTNTGRPLPADLVALAARVPDGSCLNVLGRVGRAERAGTARA